MLIMTFKLERSNDPELYDELARQPKGVRRITRLHILAHDGLVRQAAQATHAPGGDDAPGGGLDGAGLELFERRE